MFKNILKKIKEENIFNKKVFSIKHLIILGIILKIKNDFRENERIMVMQEVNILNLKKELKDLKTSKGE